jgi:hypothetical protein
VDTEGAKRQPTSVFCVWSHGRLIKSCGQVQIPCAWNCINACMLVTGQPITESQKHRLSCYDTRLIWRRCIIGLAAFSTDVTKHNNTRNVFPIHVYTPCDVKGHWTDWHHSTGLLVVLTCPPCLLNGKKFTKLQYRNCDKPDLQRCGKKKMAQLSPHTPWSNARIKVQLHSFVTSTRDGSWVVSLTPRPFDQGGKTPGKHWKKVGLGVLKMFRIIEFMDFFHRPKKKNKV